MIAVKVLNPKVAQVAISSQAYSHSSISSSNNKKLVAFFARTLVQSASNSQKVTPANNQQLIPIARNISFRLCPNNDRNKTARASTFSIASQTSPFITVELDSPIVADDTEQSESAFETLRRKAKDAVAKKGDTRAGYYGQSFNEATSLSSDRRLVVLMSWLEAKEKHIEKYRQFYLERGFDVLNVKTSPLDLLLPSSGALKISKDFVRFLLEKEYSNVVLHGFSVGGFVLGQSLLDIDKLDEPTRRKLVKSITGVIFDSVVPIEGAPIGVANSVTQNKLLAKAFEGLIKAYMAVGENIATKYYRASSVKIWGGPLRCPSLFLMSKDDKISDHKIVTNLADCWQKTGAETTRRYWDSAPHVQLFTRHNKEYVEEVEKFLTKIKML